MEGDVWVSAVCSLCGCGYPILAEDYTYFMNNDITFLCQHHWRKAQLAEFEMECIGQKEKNNA